MKTLLTKQELIDFETRVAECFNNKEIRSPIHLSNDNEDQLIEIFKNINEDDWIFCSWRSHYHVLLKGVPQERLLKDIIDNRSISLCYRDYNIFSSAIVGGALPISLGVALDIKRNNKKNRIYTFIGDMTSCTGAFFESYTYAKNFDLPITFIIEDNGKSVCTNTRETWGSLKLPFEPEQRDGNPFKQTLFNINEHLIYYYYKLDKYPHAGVGGKRIQF